MMIRKLILLYIINLCSSQSTPPSRLVEQCSKWNISAKKSIFGEINITAAGNDDFSLDLSASSLDIDRMMNTIAILDDKNRRVLVFNQTNASTLFAILFTSSNLTNTPVIPFSASVITYDHNSSIYIADGWEEQIIKIKNPLHYGKNLTLVANLTFSYNNLQFGNTPGGLCVDNIDGSIFISDQENHQIIRYPQRSSNGAIYVGNGTAGNASNQLNKPTSIVVDDNRRLFVNDAGNRRIQMFEYNSSNGTTLPVNINDCLALSLHLPNILVMNTRTSVHLFNLTDNVTTCAIGCDDNNPELNDTHNAQIDSDGNLIVSDSNRVLLYPIYQQCSDVPLASSSFLPINNCPNGTFGIGCTSSQNICDVIRPCINSVSCTGNKTIERGYTCECLSGFEGINCEIDVRLCKPYTCFERGNCINISKSDFECQCNRGYEGRQCELKVNFCANTTCQNRGVCFQEFMNFTCHCLAGFSGRYCEITDTSTAVHAYVSRSFAYVAIIMLIILIGFFIIMDALKYIFGIDPVQSERNILRRKREKQIKLAKANRPKVAYRFQYVN